MKSRFFLITIIFLFISIQITVAQNQQQQQDNGVLDGGAYTKIHVPSRKPVPFQSVRESDVMWSKTIWRKIDLREKMNHPLYYPELQIGSRMSLIDLLMWGIKKGDVMAFNPQADLFNEFKAPINIKEIEERFGAKDEVKMVEDVETGEVKEQKISGTYNSKEVKEYLVKELWFFDKQRSVIDVRIIGFCPVRYYYKPEDVEQEEVQKKQLFWISFEQARKILANHECFNPNNDAEHKTFDDIFMKRMFSSYIYQESNAYNNRMIEEYTVGIESLLEAERIKSNIMNFEMDLWEY